MALTLFDKLWNTHAIREFGDQSALLYLDRIFLHERTGGVALKSLAEDGRSIADASQVFATMDHIIDTFPGRNDNTTMPSGTDFIHALREGSVNGNITLFDIDDPSQGISHLIAAEQGIVLPGLSIACPDSHTCTLGALGALAIGIGSSDCEHALATETLRVLRPEQMRVWLEGSLRPGVSAKDVILYLISRYGADGGKGAAIEFAGPAVRAMPMNQRFTLCNMAVEFSGFSGLIAPDDKTFDYVKSRRYAPGGAVLQRALVFWETLHSDLDAEFDYELTVDCSEISPTVSWGTSPAQSAGIDTLLPAPQSFETAQQRESCERAYKYMGIQAGQRLRGVPLDAAFIGSCTNSRLADLRLAASILKGKKIAPNLTAICVPGSTPTRHAAEAEGLDRIFKDAGFEWREAGCSLCFYAGGEGFKPGQRVISTTNRNFEGRQGPGVRTHLASPATVAASALAGFICAPPEDDHA